MYDHFINLIIGMIRVVALLFYSEKDFQLKPTPETKQSNSEQHKNVQVYVEKLNGIYYAWAENKDFLFQHEKAEELARLLLMKYPDHSVEIIEN